MDAKQQTKKLLTGHASSERREHLKRYLMACVRDNVLSTTDLVGAPDKIMRTITADIVAVGGSAKAALVELGKAAAGGLLKMAGGALAGIAEDVVAGRRTR